MEREKTAAAPQSANPFQLKRWQVKLRQCTYVFSSATDESRTVEIATLQRIAVFLPKSLRGNCIQILCKHSNSL